MLCFVSRDSFSLRERVYSMKIQKCKYLYLSSKFCHEWKSMEIQRKMWWETENFLSHRHIRLFFFTLSFSLVLLLQSCLRKTHGMRSEWKIQVFLVFTILANFTFVEEKKIDFLCFRCMYISILWNSSTI